MAVSDTCLHFVYNNIRSLKRLSIQRVTKIVIFLLLILLLYNWIRPSTDDKWYTRSAPCFYGDQATEDATTLAARVHDILEHLNIRHFVCYGTLWGILRGEKLLPWDPDFDMCIIEQHIGEIDEAYLYRTFINQNIQIRYNSRHGLYELNFGAAKGELIVFQRSTDNYFYERVGWERKLYARNNMKFPVRLAEHPLPTSLLHGLTMPVPREDIEIQKYFYPEDYMVEVKPPGC